MNSKEFVLEKLRINRAREKFWVGGVAVVLTTTIINWQIQHKEIELKQIEQENKHLSQYVKNILDEDPQTRLYIAEYFNNLSYTSEARSRWNKYKQVAESRVKDEQEANRKKIELEVRLNEILEELTNPNTSKERRKQLQTEVLSAKIDIDEVRRKLKALNPTRKEILGNNEAKETESRIYSGIIGADDRIRVGNTTVPPWSAVCEVKIAAKDRVYSATGFAVSKHLVLTAGYVVDDIVSPGGIIVICGSSVDEPPFGYQSSQDIFISPSTDGFSGKPAIAGIVLAEPLPEQIGFLKLDSIPIDWAKNQTITISGYPSDHGGSQMVSYGQIHEITSERLIYRINSSAGTGGAPVFMKMGEVFKVVGIHQGGTPKGAFRIKRSDIDMLNKWIGESVKNTEIPKSNN